LTIKNEKKEIRPYILKNGIFVAGHPRSGTSLVCQLLESAGVNFLSDIKPDKYNNEGYFELSSAKELEKKLIDDAMTNENIISLNKIVKTLNDTKELSGLKIVHIPSIFFYNHIAKNIRTIFIFRNPADVKSSMLRRGISKFKLPWFENNNALISAYENIEKSIILSYESIIEGKPCVKKAFKKLGFNVDMAVIKRGSQTQKNSKLIITDEEIKLYKLLKKFEKQICK
jgi:hypothetical protein